MSWGELTCKNFGNCDKNPTVMICNPDCKWYEETCKCTGGKAITFREVGAYNGHKLK